MIYLLIEFLDELVYGVSEAAWPFIRADLHLNYVQIGLALSLPGLLANFVEPFLAILGDVWKRRVLILFGGLVFTFSLLHTSFSFSFVFLLFSFILFNPASGAFVSLSQASLMDSNPARREQNMARWTFAVRWESSSGHCFSAAQLLSGLAGVASSHPSRHWPPSCSLSCGADFPPRTVIILPCLAGPISKQAYGIRTTQYAISLSFAGSSCSNFPI